MNLFFKKHQLIISKIESSLEEIAYLNDRLNTITKKIKASLENTYLMKKYTIEYNDTAQELKEYYAIVISLCIDIYFQEQ